MSTEVGNPSIAAAKIGRSRRTLGQLWQVPVFLLGLAAVAGVAISKPIQHSYRSWSFADKLQALRQGLEDGTDPNTLLGIGEKALTEVYKYPEHEGELHYLIGWVHAKRAQNALLARSVELWSHCQESLELAKAKGVVGEDRPRLDYLLGRAVLVQGKDPHRVIELWEGSIEKGAPDRRQGYQELVKVYLDTRIQNVEKALNLQAKILDLTDAKDTEGQARVRLLTAELLLRKNSRAEAMRELDRIQGNLPPALFVQVRLQQIKLCDEESVPAKAAVYWSELAPFADHVPGGPSRVWYMLGLAHRQCDPINFEEIDSAWQKAASLGGTNGQAAALRLGELVFFLSKASTPQKAIAHWRTALDSVKSPADFKNSEIELEQVRTWFTRGLRVLTDQEDYKSARELADVYKRIAPPGVAEVQWADSTEMLAKETQGRVDRKEITAEAGQVEKLYAAAGQGFEQASTLVETDRVALLWRSAQNYLAGKQSERATETLNQFVKLEQDEKRLAHAWYLLGEAYRDQKKGAPAFQAYTKCIEYPKTPYASKARYQIALNEIAKSAKDEKEKLAGLEAAQAILLQNIEIHPPLDPKSYEDSYYKLAWVYFWRQDYDKASVFFKNAPNQFPNHPDANAARFTLGSVYRALADRATRTQLTLAAENRENLTEERKSQLEAQINHQQQTKLAWLEKSTDAFRSLADDLDAKGAKADAKELQQFRRCFFEIAENQMAAAEYLGAMKQFLQLQTRFRGEIEALMAANRVHQIHVALGRDPEFQERTLEAARQAITMAREDLKKMSPESSAFKGHRDVWTWQRWNEWLDATHMALHETPPESKAPTPKSTVFP